MEDIDSLIRDMAQRDIRPSLPRLMILEYLRTRRNHPTAEQIYGALQSNTPPVSRATVYNALGLFNQKGLVQTLLVGENEQRFDATTTAHGHFLCEQCGDVKDFFMDLDAYQADLPGDYRIRRKGVYFAGLCGNCAKKTEESQKASAKQQ